MGCLCFTGDILALISVDMYLEHAMAVGCRGQTEKPNE